MNIAAAKWMASARCSAERVGGDLHDARLIARVEHLGEGALEVDRLRRRAQHLVLDASDHALDRPQQPGGSPSGLEQRADQECRRGLAIGPGDADGLQPRGGIPVKARRDRGHRGPDRRNPHLGHPEVQRPFDDERSGSASDGVGREVMPIAGVAGDAEEERPFDDQAVVVGQR